uniref:Uncharacterized protein n=1 Tax=Rhizophora mucronata TaxID=61149 RepID=A0A2P2NK61_RHIMU
MSMVIKLATQHANTQSTATAPLTYLNSANYWEKNRLTMTSH